MIKHFKEIAVKYAEDVVSGKNEIAAGKEIIAACQRFLDDLKREDLELREHDPDLAINIMQTTLVHSQGEDLEGHPLLGQPFILQPWQVFVVSNLLGFYYKGTSERRSCVGGGDYATAFGIRVLYCRICPETDVASISIPEVFA